MELTFSLAELNKKSPYTLESSGLKGQTVPSMVHKFIGEESILPEKYEHRY